MDVTYVNTAQIQTQISSSQEGDFFITGSKEEVTPVDDYVTASTDLVQEKPAPEKLCFLKRIWLFPKMTVEANIGYGLRQKKIQNHIFAGR